MNTISAKRLLLQINANPSNFFLKNGRICKYSETSNRITEYNVYGKGEELTEVFDLIIANPGQKVKPYKKNIADPCYKFYPSEQLVRPRNNSKSKMGLRVEMNKRKQGFIIAMIAKRREEE